MSDAVRTALIGGIFALIGAIGGAATTGWSQVQLARQKFNSDLVLKALESSAPEERLESLKLLVETNLLQDAEIQKGVRAYAEAKQKNPSSIPQVSTAPILGAPVISNPRIYLLAGSKAKELLFTSYRAELENAGYKVLGAKLLNDEKRPVSEEIRFFNPEDKIQAEKIAEFVKFKLSAPQLEATLHSDSSAKPGYIEIWFGK